MNNFTKYFRGTVTPSGGEVNSSKCAWYRELPCFCRSHKFLRRSIILQLQLFLKNLSVMPCNCLNIIPIKTMQDMHMIYLHILLSATKSRSISLMVWAKLNLSLSMAKLRLMMLIIFISFKTLSHVSCKKWWWWLLSQWKWENNITDANSFIFF